MSAARPFTAPDWPALMDAVTAAAYLCMGESSFRSVAARAGLRPRETGIHGARWARRDIDALIDSMPHVGAQCGPAAAMAVTDLAVEALQNARRKLRTG